MSELKTYNSERIYWAVEQVEREAGDIEDLHLDDTLFYLKSEADKVIAELEMKLAAAKLVLRLNEPKALYSNLDTMSRLNHKIDVVERRELHQKYKRCLAMAKLCAKNVDHLNSEGYIYEKENHLDDLDDCIKRTNFYHKWYKRWLQIAKAYK